MLHSYRKMPAKAGCSYSAPANTCALQTNIVTEKITRATNEAFKSTNIIVLKRRGTAGLPLCIVPRPENHVGITRVIPAFIKPGKASVVPCPENRIYFDMKYRVNYLISICVAVSARLNIINLLRKFLKDQIG